MKTLRRTFAISTALVLVNLIAVGQQISLNGRSSIDLIIGMWNESKAGNHISLLGVKSEAKASGFLGGLSYNRWLREYVAVTLSAGVLSAEATSTAGVLGTTQRATAVIPVLLGIKYYMPEPSLDETIRPYVSVGVGPYWGFEAENTTFSQTAHTETAMGGRIGGGIDFLLGRSFKLGANLGYNVMSNFQTPVGARDNFNGFDFSMTLGILFGGRD